VRHQEHVTGDKEAIVKGVVVDVAEHGAGAEQRGTVLIQVDAKIVDQLGRVLAGLGNIGRQESSGGLLNSNDDNIGL